MRQSLPFASLPLLFLLAARPAAAQDAPPPLPLPPAPATAPAPAPATAPPTAPATAPATAPPTDAQDMQRLGELLGHFSAEASSYRAWGSGIGLGMGALLIPVGIVMITSASTTTTVGGVTVTRDEPVGLGGPIVLGLGIGSALGGILNLVLVSHPFERLSDAFEERRRAGKAPAVVVAETESEWQDKVESQRSLRKVFGVIGVVAGGLVLAGGTAFALAPISTSLTRNEQYGLAAALIATGSLSALAGIQLYFFSDPFESSYETYRRMKGPTAPRVGLGRPQLGATPVQGGAALTLGATF